MASTSAVKLISTWAVLALPFAVGCGDDGGSTPNVLTQGSDTTASATTAATTTADTAADMDDVDTTAGGGEPSFPATYRFNCMDIIELGDSNDDGIADGDAFQATLLQNTWVNDINMFKLNIMLTVSERDDEAGTATINIGSGIGPSLTDQCVEGTTASPDYQAAFDPDSAQWQPSGGQESCVEPATGDGFGGTYSLQLAASDTVYIYAQDDDGTEFNCVPGGGAPNAVPLHAITAEVTVDANNEIAGGTMTGCLLDSEAQELCSCLGVCAGDVHADCGGCPGGATPLGQLIEGVGPTDNCTRIMGAPAYDFTAGFTTQRLADPSPMACG